MPDISRRLPRICVICGEDCSRRPRTKDRAGRYYCTSCYERERALRAAAAAPPCPKCGAAMAADATVCARCGFDPREVRTAGSLRPAAAAAPTTGAAREQRTWWPLVIGLLCCLLALPAAGVALIGAVVMLSADTEEIAARLRAQGYEIDEPRPAETKEQIIERMTGRKDDPSGDPMADAQATLEDTMALMQAAAAERGGRPPPPNPAHRLLWWSRAVMLVLSAATGALALYLLIAGIGVARRSELGAVRLRRWAIADLVFFGSCVGIALLPTGSSGAPPSLLFAAIAGSGFPVWPVLILVWLTRATVRDQIEAW